jgi:cytochrome c oxidase subunit 2
MLSLATLFDSTLPEQASNHAAAVDTLYTFIMWLSWIGLIGLMGVMVYFMVKYRRRTDNDKTAYITHNHKLEFIWSFVPMLIFVGIAIWGWRVYSDMQRAPKDAMTVYVTGRQWQWTYQYQNGVEIADDLVVPVNTPISLDMTSTDVLHSFYVPSFRVKKDVVPGMRTTLWFSATKVGDFRIFCAEYCGTAHSRMYGYVKVLSQADYKTWMDKKAYEKKHQKKSLAELGEDVYKKKGCTTCHSVDGTSKIGPTLKGLWDKKRVFEDGPSIKADADYIRESLLSPTAKVVKGFAPRMPPYQGQLSEEEVNQIIEFIKTLK